MIDSFALPEPRGRLCRYRYRFVNFVFSQNF
jgi:hypothetical protein